MERIVGNEPVHLARSGAVAALGVFDGVHRGHKAVLDRATRLARGYGVPSVAVTFDPHPLAVLRGTPPPELCGLDERLERLAALGLDAAWIIPFTRELAGEEAADFAARVFRDQLGSKAVVCGYSSHFGKDQAGDGQRLAEWGADWGGWHAETVGPVTLPPPDGRPVASTTIRKAVAEGQLDAAGAMLGRRFSLRGRIVRGRRLARTLGCPTANLDVPTRVKPPPGVYAVWLRVWDPLQPGLVLSEGGAVANIGPFRGEPDTGPGSWLVEAHAFDAEAKEQTTDWYGMTAEITLAERLRSPMAFRDAEDAKSWIAADQAAALNWWSRHGDFDPEASL